MTYQNTQNTGGIFNKDFYPTPRTVIGKMLGKIGATALRGSQILEPSAGKGDILDVLRGMAYEVRPENLYAVEIEPDLAAILRSKEYRVVGSDFLKYDDHYHIDVIVMNPPFSDSVDHLLKAWEIVRPGGQIVCLLNAETIRNPHTGKRKLLGNLIDQHGATEFIGTPFEAAERRTSVECVIVHLKKPAEETSTHFQAAGMRFDSKANEEQFSASPLASANIIESLVHSYNCAAKIMIERHKLEQAYKFYMGGIVDREDEKGTQRPLNARLNEIKQKFWTYVFDKTQIGKRATSKFREGFEKFVGETSQLAFSVENIMTVLEMFFANQEGLVLQCVSDVFDKATAYHEKNVIHTEGWKTNKSWKIGPKIILPCGVKYDDRRYGSGFTIYRYDRKSAYDFYEDMDRACCFLSGKRLEDINTIISAMEKKDFLPDHSGCVVESTFFTIQMFKKETVHLVWKDRELLNTFNQAAAKHKKWLGAGF